MIIIYLELSFGFEPQEQLPEHLEQSHPHDVLPFFLSIIDFTITPPTISTAQIITIISIGFIYFVPFEKRFLFIALIIKPAVTPSAI